MKVLMFFYVVIWIYAVYYSCYLLHRLLGNDATPLFVAFGLLFAIKWITNLLGLITRNN